MRTDRLCGRLLHVLVARRLDAPRVLDAHLEERIEPEERVDVARLRGFADLALGLAELPQDLLRALLALDGERLRDSALEAEREGRARVDAVRVLMDAAEIDEHRHRHDAQETFLGVDEVHREEEAAGLVRQRRAEQDAPHEKEHGDRDRRDAEHVEQDHRRGLERPAELGEERAEQDAAADERQEKPPRDGRARRRYAREKGVWIRLVLHAGNEPLAHLPRQCIEIDALGLCHGDLRTEAAPSAVLPSGGRYPSAARAVYGLIGPRCRCVGRRAARLRFSRACCRHRSRAAWAPTVRRSSRARGASKSRTCGSAARSRRGPRRARSRRSRARGTRIDGRREVCRSMSAVVLPSFF